MVDKIDSYKPFIVAGSLAAGGGAGWYVGKNYPNFKKPISEDTFIKDMEKTLEKHHYERKAKAAPIAAQLSEIFDSKLSFEEAAKVMMNGDDLKLAEQYKESVSRGYLHSIIKENADFYSVEPHTMKSLDEVIEEFIGNRKAIDAAQEFLHDIKIEFKFVPDFKASAKEYYNIISKEAKKSCAKSYALAGAALTGLTALGWAMLSNQKPKKQV